MPLFSQRQGIKPVKSFIQIDSVDVDLRNSLWNALCLFYWNQLKGQIFIPSSSMKEISILLNYLWLNYFKWQIDTLSNNWLSTYSEIKNYFFSCQWYEVYDFVEYVANNYQDENRNSSFMKFCNKVLEREVSAYRFVGSKVTQITSEAEIAEVEEVLEDRNPLLPVTIHLEQALSLLADRKSPDYRNSIKESISAVEAICKIITSNATATLGQALGEIERKVSIHPALKSSFSKLYGYTNDADGIRHALLEEPNLKFEDAKFMLVTCSAFINYLKSKVSEDKNTVQ